MTTPPAAFPPPPPIPPHQPQAQPSRRRVLVAVALAGVVLVAATAGITTAIVSGSEDPKPGEPRPAATASTAAEPLLTEEPEEEPQAAYNTEPDASDFTLTLKKKRQQCFGSAGCNVTVEPDLSYTAVLPLDPEVAYSITYEIKGGDDGPVIETLELTDGDQLSYSEVSVSTPGSGTKLTAEVTDVESDGSAY